ncbi:major facilitator superfamily transporter [Colletotrichum navitas]|uniref:Major facilitator superfamily transporter n=1 Tax=Colletotrichum navitas TaxID=681940 RepID=A0AAD8V924_9PEZI|nr:major facilitator superfamily transporter [Colletotrichum navitas]KAK1598832.1 major facilitator superfamily transporter [Colletotrichum navitas]
MSSPTTPSSEKHARPETEQNSLPISDNLGHDQNALSRDGTIQPANPAAKPDGGLLAWMQVVGGFILFFNSWGILSTFGVYQTTYESGALFRESSSNIAWIGAIQYCIAMLTGFWAGPVYDRGYLRTLLFIGTFGLVLGHMFLSLCHEYWQVLLAQGFMVGTAAGCLFLVCISTLPQYFDRNLGLAAGIATSGSSFGGIIYPIAYYHSVDRVGFAWATRILGFIALATLVVPLCVMKARMKPVVARSFVDWTAFRDGHYMAFVLGTFFGSITILILNTYISFYGQSRSLLNDAMAFDIVSVFNAASCLGRILPNFISDICGPLNIFAPFMYITGAVALCMMAVSSQGGIIALAVILGFLSGAFPSLLPVCFARLTKDKSKLGTRMGMGYALSSLGYLAGGPGGGGILGRVEPLEWNGLWIYCGVSSFVAASIYTAIRFYDTGLKLRAKA